MKCSAPLLLSFVALCASACAPPATTTAPPEGEAQVAATDGCGATASKRWTPLSGVYFDANAAAVGADCAQATATLTITDPGGRTLYTENFPTAQVMVLAPAHDTASMQSALADWIDQDGAMMPTTSALPEWRAGADAPSAGEFPFYPEEGMTRDAYTEIRASGTPLFCFVQGMESMACLALRDGAFTKVGVQSFPG